MTKEKYKEIIQNQYDYTLEQIRGWHESVNILKSLSDYVIECITITEDVYNDKDIDFSSYVELSEMINYKFKEVCRIVKNS